MELSPLIELHLFFICFLCGISLGLLFDLFRIPRRLFSVSSHLTHILDLLYFMTAAGLTAWILLSENSGILRGYEIIALGLGIFFYLLCLSRFLLPFLVRLTAVMLFLIKKFLFFITFPLRIFAKPVIIISINLRRFFRKNKKSVAVIKKRFSHAWLFLKKT